MFKRPKKRKVHGLVCGSSKEAFYINEVVESGIPLPSKPKFIQTPIGRYTPDFEYPDKYIEIKGPGTFRVMQGFEPYMRGGKTSDLQWRKIQWVAENIKPVEIIVLCKNPDEEVSIDTLPENIVLTKRTHK